MFQNELNSNHSPILSVVIPVYNTAAYLEQALDSILTQDYLDFEIIAINDGSQDESGKLLNSYKNKDSRIRVYHRENSGLSATRNFGFKKASGSYVYFFDSDDILVQGAFKRLVNLLKSTGSEIIAFSGRYIDENGNIIHSEKSLEKAEVPEPITGEKLLVDMITSDIYSPVVSMYMYRRSFLQNNQLTFQEGYIHEDEFYTIKALCTADRALSVSDVLYEHRLRDGSIMRNKPGIKNVRGWSEAVSKILAFTEKYPLAPTTYEIVMARAKLLTHNSLGIIHNLNKEKGTFLNVDDYFSEIQLAKLGFDVQLRSKHPTLFRVYNKLKKLVSGNANF